MAQNTDSSPSDTESASIRPTTLELASSIEFQHILEQLKNSPSLQNSLFSFNRNSPITMNNFNSQHFIGLYQGLSAGTSPQASNRLSSAPASSGASLIFLANPATTAPSTPGQILFEGSNPLQHMSVNLCSPVAIASSAQQPATLANYTTNNGQQEVLQPVLLQTSLPKTLDYSTTTQTAASAGRSKRSHELVDHTHIQRLERKRARNRDAAKKCRERKLSLIHSLQGYVQQLVEDNKAMRLRIVTEKEEIKRLKIFVVDHMEKECSFIHSLKQEEL